MLKEFVDKIQDMAQGSLRPQILEIPGQPLHVKTVAMPSGRLERIVIDAEPRDHKVGKLSSLVDLVVQAQETDQPVIWYSRSGVVAILDNEYRRDRVTFPLEYTPQILQLKAMEASTCWLDQKAMIRLLRVQLAGCCDRSVVHAIRSIKWRTNEEGKAEIQHGKASVGKALMSELEGASVVPDEFLLDVSIFKTFGTKFDQVPCAFEIEPSTQKFSLQPLPGGIEAAVQSAERELGEVLGSLLMERVDTDSPEVQIYHGQP